MSDRHLCRVCGRWVGGGVGHDPDEHDGECGDLHPLPCGLDVACPDSHKD